MGTVAEGIAGGASDALRVTRTVSFLRGTLDVCVDGAGGWFSFSLMRGLGSLVSKLQLNQFALRLSNPQPGISLFLQNFSRANMQDFRNGDSIHQQRHQ